MIALEIDFNGQRLCLAGADDLTVLNAAVGAVGLLGSKVWDSHPLSETPQETAVKGPHFHLHVGGLTRRGPDIEDSAPQSCRGVDNRDGDTVTVRIVDIDPAEADRPVKEQPTDAFTSANTEKRMFERAKETYLALREKYGDGAA
jgi:hypothetical protein